MVYQKWLYILIIGLVIFGGINWLSIGVLDLDILRLFMAPRHAKWIYIVVGLAALSLAFCRDIYLPFLGETVLPGGALSIKTPQNANDQITIQTLPNVKVVYWAAEPNPTQGTDLPPWNEAYGEFENSGVALADDRGTALLRFRGQPQAYRVPLMGKLKPHVHFRVCDDNGIMGKVHTRFIESGNIEAFSNLL